MKKFAEIKDGMISNVAVFSDNSELPENHIDVTDIRCGKGDRIIDGLPVLKPSKYHTWDGSKYEIISENQKLSDAEDKKRNNSKAKKNLEIIDGKSIRSIREFLIAKFGDDDLMSTDLKNHEADAVSERMKII